MAISKEEQAVSIIKNCIGENGIWASTGRYAHQCWTRDFCIATRFVFMNHPALTDYKIIEKHLTSIAAHQQPNGKIPILYLDNEKKFLSAKISQAIETQKVPFMLKRYLEDGLEDLTPHTRDSEVLYIIAVMDFLNDKRTNVSPVICTKLELSANAALKYLEENILSDGLIAGADWRDVRLDLDDKCILTNACLLYRAYKLMGSDTKANDICSKLHEFYWKNPYFLDYPLTDKFDLLGNALAILYGIANEEQTEAIFTFVKTLSSPHGIPTMETFLPPLNLEEKNIMERDQAVIWPWTNGYMLSAMFTKGDPKWSEFATKEFAKWEKLDGFYEWYDIVDGKGYGSIDQVWSAALYLTLQCLSRT